MSSRPNDINIVVIFRLYTSQMHHLRWIFIVTLANSNGLKNLKTFALDIKYLLLFNFELKHIKQFKS